MPVSQEFPDSFFRVTVKGLCVRDGKVLLLRESEVRSGQWELPGGGLDFGEDITQGLRREIEEETGLKVKMVSKNPVYAWTWLFENKRGLDWFYSLVLAYRIELEHLAFTPTDECLEVKFFSKNDLNTIQLCQQTNGLKAIFNPLDFD